tara:strand:- start:11770 stop:11943 length:174 start_codon:yes stop_codon:yes gene_type:complete
MKKTIMATNKNNGNKIVSRHCYNTVVDRMQDIVVNEAARIIGNSEDVEITITDKIEF